jgi:circadian clock protein KaiB
MRKRKDHYRLRLYITGETPRSLDAVSAIRAICEERLQGRYDLEIVDLRRHPELARREQIIALPLLVRSLPAPLRRMIGNLSDLDRVLHGLDLLPAP